MSPAKLGCLDNYSPRGPRLPASGGSGEGKFVFCFIRHVADLSRHGMDSRGPPHSRLSFPCIPEPPRQLALCKRQASPDCCLEVRFDIFDGNGTAEEIRPDELGEAVGVFSKPPAFRTYPARER